MADAGEATEVINLVEYTVSELAFALKRTLEDALASCASAARSRASRPASSGHAYFR